MDRPQLHVHFRRIATPGVHLLVIEKDRFGDSDGEAEQRDDAADLIQRRTERRDDQPVVILFPSAPIAERRAGRLRANSLAGLHFKLIRKIRAVS